MKRVESMTDTRGFLAHIFPEEMVAPSQRQLDVLSRSAEAGHSSDTEIISRSHTILERLNQADDRRVLGFGLIATGAVVHTGALLAEAANLVESADMVGYAGIGAFLVGAITSAASR